MANLYPLPKQHYHAPDGALAVGYQLCFFEPGTANPKTTWQDPLQVATNTNPVILDARGEADVWLTGTYDVALKTPGGATVWTVLAYSGGPISTVSTAQEGLVENGSFETNAIDNTIPDGWDITTYNPSGVFTYDATTQSNGSKCVKFTSAGVGGGYAQTSGYIVADELATYEIAFKYKTDIANVRVVAEIFWYTGTLGSLAPTTVLDDSATNPAVWTLKSYGVTPPATARYAKIRLTGCHSSVGTHGSAWFDNVELRRTVSLTTGVSGILPIVNGGTGGILPIVNGGTGQATANTALNALIPSQAAAKGKVLLTDGSNTLWTPLPRKNFVTNGIGSVAQRDTVGGTDVLKNAAAGVAVRGSCDMFSAYWSGTACTAGSLYQYSSAAVGRTGYAHRFANVTLTGTGVLYHRTRIESKDAKALKNQSASFQVKVLHDIGVSVNFRLYVYKADSENNFTTVTLIAASGFVGVGDSIATPILFENVSMGDCSNGIEVLVQILTGAIAGKNIYLTEYQAEVGSVSTDFEYESFSQTLSRCQRYLPALISSSVTQMLGNGLGQSTTLAYLHIHFPTTTARVSPAGLTASNGAHITLYDGVTGTTSTAIALVWYSPGSAMISATVASGLTQFRPYMAYFNNASAYLLFTGAEL
jgi:hypothetical protein